VVRTRRARRGLAIGTAFAAVLALAACDPPDGRDLSVVVADPPTSVEVGGSATLEAVVANVGTAPATGAEVNVLAPLGVAIDVEGTLPCAAEVYVAEVDQVTTSCPVGTVEPGAEVDVVVTLTGEAAGGEGDVVVSAQSTGGAEPKTGGAPQVVRLPFSVEPRVGVDLHVEGGGLDLPVVDPATGTSRTTVVNRGMEAAGPVTVTQQLTGPVTVAGTPTLERADGGATGSCSTAGLTVTCTTGSHDVAPFSVPDDRWILEVPVGSTASFPTSFSVAHSASSPDPEPIPDRFPATDATSGNVEGLYLLLDGPSEIAAGSTFEVSVDDASYAYWGPYYRFTVPPTMRLDSPCQGTGTFSCVVNVPVTTFELTALAPGGPASFSASFQAEGLPAAGGSIPIEVVDPVITSDVHPSSTPPDFGLLGQTFTVAGEVRTSGPTAHEDVVVEADAPSGTVVEGARWGDLGQPCATSGRTIRCEVGDLEGHSQVPFEIDLRSYRTGAVGVAMGVTSSTPQDEPDPWPDEIVVEVPVRTPFTDLEVTATPPTAPAVQGTSYDVTYRATNRGSDPATGVVMTVVLPDGFSVNGTPSWCSYSGRIVTCPFGELGPGEVRQTTVRTWAGPPGATSIDAMIVGDQPEPDPDPHPNEVSTPVDPQAPNGDLVATIQPSSTPAVVGTQTGRSVTIENKGPSFVPGVTWEVTVPDGWRLDEITGSNAHLCTVDGNRASCGPTMVYRTSFSFLLRLTPLEVRSGDVLQVTVTGGLPDPDPASNVAQASLTSVPVGVDLSVEAGGTLPHVFVPGGSGSWSAVVRNAGPAVATGVVLSGTVPEAATITAAQGSSATCTFDAHSYSCTTADILPGGSRGVTLSLTWANVPGPLTYHVEASAAEPEVDPDVGPNSIDHPVISTAQPRGIEGVVVGPDGTPIAGASVRFYRDSDGLLPYSRIDTDANGRFSLRGVVLYSAFRVSVTPPAGSPWAAEWYQDVPTRTSATLLTVTPMTPLHVIEVRLG
jgi:hypothetical protein